MQYCKCNTVELSTDYCEHSSVEVKSGNGESLIITSVYRSPSSNVDNNTRLLQLLQEISETNFTYKIVLGDFNLPLKNWEKYTTEEGQQGFSTMFIEKIRDCFFSQHIKEIIRQRGENRGSILDLLFSNDETIIDEINLCSPLGRSDHACVHVMCDLRDMEARGKSTYY